MKARLNQYRAFTLLILLSSCAHPAPKIDTTTLTLLHTNDFHSQIEPMQPSGEPEQGGAARVKTLISEIRKEKGADNVLLVSAGDNFQGSLFYNVWKGSAEMMVMNDWGYDAASLGNHEFDLGSAELARALAGKPIEVRGKMHAEVESAHFPVITTNLDASKEAELDKQLVKHAIVEKNGQKYGILGVTTETAAVISNPGKNVKFLNYVEAVQKEVGILQSQGINKIILLSHTGYPEDLARIPQLSGVDVIVAAHDHALLADPKVVKEMGLPKQVDRIRGPYPTIAKDKDGHNVVVVTAMEKGRWLGNIDVTFDKDGLVTAWNPHEIFVHGCEADGKDCSKEVAKPDAVLAAKIAEYNKPIAEFANEVVGKSTADFGGYHDDIYKTPPFGWVVADALLDYTKDSDKAQAAVLNMGGIRAGLNKGTVTYGAINTALPFPNSVAVVEVTGDELVTALDNGFSGASGQSDGAFPHIAGMKISYCKTKSCHMPLHKNGQTVSVQMAGKKLDLKAHYRITTNDYLLSGGDFYEIFKTACHTKGRYCRDTGSYVKDVVADWFRKHHVASPSNDKRLEIAHEMMNLAERADD